MVLWGLKVEVMEGQTEVEVEMWGRWERWAGWKVALPLRPKFGDIACPKFVLVS